MESTPEEAAEGLAIVRVLAAVLDRLVCANSHLVRTEQCQITKFHALKAPGIGIQQYLERIHKYASCSSQCFIMALIYIDRLIQRNNFLLTELNVHRVIVTAVLLAAKFFDDAYYNNAYYAKVGGVLVSEMNGLEVDFLFRINFSLHVTPDLFEQYRVELLSHSGVDSLSFPPPPQPQYMVEQQMVAAPMPQLNERLHQSMMTNPLNGMGFPVMTNAAGQAPVSAPVPQITPSPPRHSTGASAVGLSGATTNSSLEDEIMVVVQQHAMRSNLPNLFPYEYGYLQRANSLPVQAKSLVNQIVNSQPQPLSAPAMMAMIPGVGNDQFIVLDNQVYRLPGTNTMIQQHRHQLAMNAAAGCVMDASGLIHHVHHQAAVAAAAGGSQQHHHHHHHHVPGFVSREATVAQRFAAAGQMVAGVSGGL